MKEKPKRRKKKDNPYILEYLESENKYKIKFKNSHDINNSIDVSEKIYETFNRFELEDIAEMNEYDRHIEHSQLTEITLNKRASKKQIDLEDLVIKRMEYKKLHNAILKLPEIQKKRLMLYFFKGLTLKKLRLLKKHL